MTSLTIEGPYFDQLSLGQRFDQAPSYTLSEGRAAVHQTIVGDRLRLPLDDVRAQAVAGRSGLAHPAFVWDVAIGQSTVATHHVKANLFYRNLVFARLPSIGDTLTTCTEVVGLRENRRREGRKPTGLVALRMVTTDQEDRPILDFYRCAMLPLRGSGQTGDCDDLDSIGGTSLAVDLLASVEGWSLPADRSAAPAAGDECVVVGGDVVSSAPELARLTLNVAQVHHDHRSAGGSRLVYGGHTIGIALAQATRAFPDLVTVLGWHSCDHLAPVYEGATLTSTVEVEAVRSSGKGVLGELRSRVFDAGTGLQVLDWRFVALF